MNRDLRLRIEGAMLERLLEQALSSGAMLACVHRLNNRALIVECDRRSADILLSLCERYHLNYKVLRAAGRTALLHTLRCRSTLVAGLLLCTLLCSLALSRIWIIDLQFTGPCAHLGQEQSLRSCLEEMHIRPGISASALETVSLQKQLLANAGDYSHIGLRRQGIRLLVEAAPEVPAPQVYTLAEARDLVAAMDGVVCSINVKSGQACVQVGDTVRKGQLLIRGEEEKSKEETTAVSALGEVHVRRWYEGSAQAQLRSPKICRTGRSSFSRSIRLCGWNLPLSEGENYLQQETETQIIPIGGLFIPLEMICETNHETENRQIAADPSALQTHLSMLARAAAQAALTKNGPQTYEIVDYWEESTTESNILRTRAVYEITTDIAVSRDALIEEVYQTWKAADK